MHNLLPEYLWSEAVLKATHLINRLPKKGLEYQSFLDLLSRNFPPVELKKNLIPRMLGSVASVYIHRQGGSQLDMRSTKCVPVGYSCTHGVQLL